MAVKQYTRHASEYLKWYALRTITDDTVLEAPAKFIRIVFWYSTPSFQIFAE